MKRNARMRIIAIAVLFSLCFSLLMEIPAKANTTKTEEAFRQAIIEISEHAGESLVEDPIKDLVYETLGYGIAGAIDRGTFEALLNYCYYNQDFDWLDELKEIFLETDPEVKEFVGQALYIYKVAENIHNMSIAMKDMNNIDEEDKREEYLNAMISYADSLFSLCSDTASLIPAIGTFVAFPFEIGKVLLIHVKLLAKLMAHRNFTPAYVLAYSMQGTGGRNDQDMFMLHCTEFGLTDATFDTHIKNTLKLIEVIESRQKLLELMKVFESEPGISDQIDAYARETDNKESDVEKQVTVYAMFDEFSNNSGKHDYKIVMDGEWYKIVRKEIDGTELIVYSYKGKLTAASKVSSPLVIDLDGDGMETVSINEGIYFDHSASGFKILTGWVGPAEGIVVRDINGNGIIDNGRELFGDTTILKNGKTASNGFIALAELDSNGDGLFTASEAKQYGVKIWIDSDCDGISAENELFDFEEVGVESIDLAYEEINIIDKYGNSYNQKSIAIMSDGSMVDIIDIWFTRDAIYSESVENIEIPADILALPNIRSLGTAYSLHQAMVLDKSGALKALVEEFVSEIDREVRIELTKQIIYKWTGKNTNIGVLEVLQAEQYTGGKGTNAMGIINTAFDRLTMAVYEHLMAASHLKEFYYSRRAISSGKDSLSQAGRDMLKILKEDQQYGERLLSDWISNLT